jgi:hypothetical protein
MNILFNTIQTLKDKKILYIFMQITRKAKHNKDCVRNQSYFET